MGSQAALVKSFAGAIEHAYAQKTEPIEDQLKFDAKYAPTFKADYDKASRIVAAAADVRLLGDAANAYLDLFFKYAPKSRNNVHYVRSDQTFLDLVARCKKISTAKHDLFKEWSAQLNAADDNRFRKRLQELSPTYRSQVLLLAPKPVAAKPTRILDYLRNEFLRQRTRKPASNDELYGLDPAPTSGLRSGLDGFVSVLQSSWSACVAGNQEAPRGVLHLQLDAYRGWLHDVGMRDVLQLFQVIKWLQDRVTTRYERAGTGVKRVGGDQSPLTCELYAMACLELLLIAQGKLLIAGNRERFTKEESEYFLKPLRNPVTKSAYEYYSNIEDRLTRKLGDVGQAFGLTKTFLDIILITQNQLAGASLVPLGATLALQKQWEELEAFGTKLETATPSDLARMAADPETMRLARLLFDLVTVEVPLTGPNIAQATARVGSSPGAHKLFGTITIIRIVSPQKQPRFYVEFEGLKPNLFVVDASFIASKVYGSRIYGVYSATAGMVYIVQGIFLMMGFMPVFIESGFAGLLYEILVYYGSSKLEEQAEKVHPFFGKLVGLIAMIAAPRPHFGPKVVEPPGLSLPEAPRLEIVEVKGGAAIENKSTAQLDAPWFDRAATDMETQRRGLPGDPELTGGPRKQQAADKLAEAEKPTHERVSSRPDRPSGKKGGGGGASDDPESGKGAVGGGPASRPRSQKVQQQQTRRRPADPDDAAKSGDDGKTSGKATDDRKLDAAESDPPARKTTGTETGGRAGAAPSAGRSITGRGGGVVRLVGDEAALAASQRGYHVYEYLDAQGRVLYVGRSGSIQEGSRVNLVAPGTAERRFNSWVDRLRDDHADAAWMGDAQSVRVTYDVSEAEMLALEEVRIDQNQASAANWNSRQGDFTARYGRTGADLRANYQAALKRPTARFSIRALRGSPR